MLQLLGYLLRITVLASNTEQCSVSVRFVFVYSAGHK